MRPRRLSHWVSAVGSTRTPHHDAVAAGSGSGRQRGTRWRSVRRPAGCARLRARCRCLCTARLRRGRPRRSNSSTEGRPSTPGQKIVAFPQRSDATWPVRPRAVPGPRSCFVRLLSSTPGPCSLPYWAWLSRPGCLSRPDRERSPPASSSPRSRGEPSSSRSASASVSTRRSDARPSGLLVLVATGCARPPGRSDCASLAPSPRRLRRVPSAPGPPRCSTRSPRGSSRRRRPRALAQSLRCAEPPRPLLDAVLAWVIRESRPTSRLLAAPLRCAHARSTGRWSVRGAPCVICCHRVA